MLCTAPAASGHFYQLTERKSEMRKTLATFDMRPSAGNATNITEHWWSQWRRRRSVLSDSCTYCRSRTPNICDENKFMWVSEGSCIRITWLSDEKRNCKSFEYKTSFCRSPPPTLLPLITPVHIELASKRSWRGIFLSKCTFAHWSSFVQPGSFFVQWRKLYSLYGCLQRKMGLQKWRWRRSLLLNVPHAKTSLSSQNPINGRNVIVHEAVLSTFTRWS